MCCLRWWSQGVFPTVFPTVKLADALPCHPPSITDTHKYTQIHTNTHTHNSSPMTAARLISCPCAQGCCEFKFNSHHPIRPLCRVSLRRGHSPCCLGCFFYFLFSFYFIFLFPPYFSLSSSAFAAGTRHAVCLGVPVSFF